MLDDDDLLWVDRDWVALTQAQAPVVRLLLEHLDQVVPFGELQAADESVEAAATPPRCGPSSRASPRDVRSVGLELVTVRRRGMILTSRVAAG